MNKEQLPKGFGIISDGNNSKEIVNKLIELGYRDDIRMNGDADKDSVYHIENGSIKCAKTYSGKTYSYSEFQELIISPKELTELPERWYINSNVSKEDKYWFIEQNKKVGGRLGFDMCDYYIMTNEFRYENISTDKPNYPELTINQLKQYFKNMEEKQEKWVECVDNESTKTLTIGKRYKIEDENSEYYYITNDLGVRSTGGYYKRRFKEINNMEKEIIGYKCLGYKCPQDLFGKEVKKGTLYKARFNNNYYVPEGYSNTNNITMPKEIVETWEPVYKTKETILQIGSPSKKVTISKGKIEVEGYKVSVHSLHSIIAAHKTEVGSWTVKDIKFQIGCSWFELNEIQKVVDAYKEACL